ncbi:MAG: sugar ABC transporter permease, partial [Alphaproteobacteria bacterium]|nr:sugar ABC transporter permease [Alphaproteobacteria bacterium]
MIRLDLARPSRQHWLGYALLAPAVLLIAAIIVYPLFVSIDLSFQNVGIARLDRPRRPFTIANYERLFASPDFWNACWVTLKLTIVVSAACFLL